MFPFEHTEEAENVSVDGELRLTPPTSQQGVWILEPKPNEHGANGEGGGGGRGAQPQPRCEL